MLTDEKKVKISFNSNTVTIVSKTGHVIEFPLEELSDASKRRLAHFEVRNNAQVYLHNDLTLSFIIFKY